MKKITKKVTKEAEVTASSPELLEREYEVCTRVEKLSVAFPQDDLNKLVEKLNEVIEKLNKCQ